MAAAAKEDFGPLRVLVNDDQRLERLKSMWSMRKDEYADMTGPLIGAEVMFSTMSGYQPGATESIVRIAGKTGSFFYRLIWVDGKMIGVGPSQPPRMVPLTLQPLGDNEFFTYDISAARNIRLAFVGDSVMIGGEDGGVRAVRGQ